MRVAIGHDSHRFIVRSSEQAGSAEPTVSRLSQQAGGGQAQPVSSDNPAVGSQPQVIQPQQADSSEPAVGYQPQVNGIQQQAGIGKICPAPGKPLILGGVVFDCDCPALEGNSDSDVVLHALCNAISGVTTVNILGDIADKMCAVDGITDSSFYVKEAQKHLGDRKIVHISLSIECKRPRITPMIPAMRDRISEITGVPTSSIGITATSGEELTDFGKGLGIQVFCIITAESV